MNKPAPAGTVIACHNLRKTFADGKGSLLEVLQPLDFALRPGEHIAIVGASGSGKSTLLHLLAGLDNPTQGQIWHQGKDITQISETERSALRNRSLGFVYQFHHLLPDLSAIENVMMPLLIRRMKPEEAHERAQNLLDSVGLLKRLEHRPSMLSGGERQRVALARALVTEPDCLLADEPTGNLDQLAAKQMIDLMLELNTRRNTALLLVTHDYDVAKRLGTCLRLTNGLLAPANIE
ncbi:MAG: lipoprotein-releasing ABC transporter ATP-binding protein LolD [Pseudomonadota bacterium]